jgi:hypothetical protein
MTSRRPGFLILGSLLLLAPLAASAQAAGAGAGSTSVTGTVASVKGLTFAVTLADGTTKTVTLEPDALILDREPAAPVDIAAGDAVGVAATKGNDSLTATAITIFSPSMWDGIRKGQFSMADGEVMTNAMTGAVAKNTQGRTLTLKLELGTATILVPDDVKVTRLVTVKPEQLTVGLKVTFRGTAAADGSLAATTASFDQPARG